MPCLMYFDGNSFLFSSVISSNLCQNFFLTFHMTMYTNTNFCLQLSHGIDTNSTADRMFNTVTEAWDYTRSWQPHVQRYLAAILETNFKYYRLLACWLHHRFESAQYDMTRAGRVPSAKSGSQTTSLYDTHVICITSPLTRVRWGCAS